MCDTTSILLRNISKIFELNVLIYCCWLCVDLCLQAQTLCGWFPSYQKANLDDFVLLTCSFVFVLFLVLERLKCAIPSFHPIFTSSSTFQNIGIMFKRFHVLLTFSFCYERFYETIFDQIFFISSLLINDKRGCDSNLMLAVALLNLHISPVCV